MTANAKISGAWKDVPDIQAKVSGTWKTIDEGYSKISGVWKQFYSAIAPSAYELIETVEFDGNEGLVFTNIPQDYKHLELRWVCRSDATNTGYTIIVARPNNVSSGYTRHGLEGTGSSVISTASTGDGALDLGRLPRNQETANVFSAGVTSFLDYSDTSKYTTMRSIAAADRVGLYSGLYTATTAITSLSVLSGSVRFLAGSRASLYGIKDS